MGQTHSVAVSTQFQETAWRAALALSIITIAYNAIEGLVSVWYGLQDEALSLFGFGVDSFVEVISGIGILHLVLRMRTSEGIDMRDAFERKALRTTGGAFYVLSGSLVLSVIAGIFTHHEPITTFWGIVISLVSICTMAVLIHFKLRVGTTLGSEAIIADAHCTRACLYLSVVLLAASAGYEYTGIAMLDELGSLGIAWFAYREGKEAFEKSRGSLSCQSCAC